MGSTQGDIPSNRIDKFLEKTLFYFGDNRSDGIV